MAFIIKTRVKETTATTGTGTYALSGAVTGYQGFSAVGNSNSTEYVATNNIGWEHGVGVVSTAPSQITRAVILESSNGGAAVNWGAGTKEIFCSPHPSMLQHSGEWPVAPACRLLFTSSTVCTLTRHNGKHVPVILNGVARYRELSSSGVTLGLASLAANTTYHVYCPFTGNLEASTTVGAIDADTGIKTKSGDVTRTYVGMVRVNGSTQFQDDDAKRLVATWFNRRRKRLRGGFSVNRSTTSTTNVELNSEARVECVAFAEDWQQFTLMCNVDNTAAGNASIVGIGIDSTTVSSSEDGVTNIPNTSGTYPITVPLSIQTADGFRFAAILGRVSVGTMVVRAVGTVLEGFVYG